ncbi:MAG: DMT family transporter [Elusimicrobiaceae bacterium]|nr:DMT family transporter [Elusimicrobiaceae bacterium]
MNPLLAAWLCWGIIGISPIAGHYAATVINPVLLVFCATLLACLSFTPYLNKKNQWSVLFAKETRWKFLFIGTFGTAFSFSVLLWALHYTTATNAAILQQSELIYALLFSVLFLKEKPKCSQFFASALILIGSLLILIKEQYSPRWTGDLMILGSTWMLQAASCVAKKLPKHLDYRTIAAARNFYALPALTILLVWQFYQEGVYCHLNFTSLTVIFYTGVLKYGLAMILWYQAIRMLDLAKVSAIYLSYPVLTFSLSVLLGLEKTQPYQFVGLLLSLAGSYLISNILKKQQEHS